MREDGWVGIDHREALKALEEQAPDVLREWMEKTTCDPERMNRWMKAATGKICKRPWGYFEILAEGPGYKVKRLVIDPGKRTSLQWHEKRWERWTVVAGDSWGFATGCGISSNPAEQDVVVHGNDYGEDIAVNCLHRIINDGEKPLVIIEVQNFVDADDPSTEEDVYRVEDDYGRGE